VSHLRTILVAASAVAIAFAIGTPHAAAQTTFKGKTVTIYVGSGAGGAYDTYARLLGRHFARHVPGNPNVVVTNMPGASGRRMIGFIHNIAPKDGTAIGTGLSTRAFDPMMAPGEKSTFDAQRLAWVGSSNKETTTCIMWHESPIHYFDDAKKRVTQVGSSGPSSTDAIYPNVLNYLFGTKFKVINGYASGPQMSLAIESGELDGRCGLTWSSLQSINADWTRANKVRIILQFALERDAELPDVPLVFDLAQSERQRQILTLWAAPNQMGRPYFLPPDTPPATVEALRRAFDATIRDPDYVADAKKVGVGANPITGEEVTALVRKVYATPAEVVAEAGAAAKGN
jgi:tripartite-type tricarboxylate transporter receptor subunit TctC